jgi:hypothetical protein
LWSYICAFIGPLRPSLEALAFGAVQAGLNAAILWLMSGPSEVGALALLNIFGGAAIKYLFLKANISFTKDNLSLNLPLDPAKIKDAGADAGGANGGK